MAHDSVLDSTGQTPPPTEPQIKSRTRPQTQAETRTQTRSPIEPLDWARGMVQIETSKLRSERPWATTWRIEHSNGRAWLKHISPALADAPVTLQAIGRAFPDHAPQARALDAANGLILLDDHGGRSLRHSLNNGDNGRLDEQRCREILSVYATLQGQAQDKQELLSTVPRVDIRELVDELLIFLGAPGQARLSGASVTAGTFLSRHRCRTYRTLIEPARKRLIAYLEGAAILPDTVNHGDLRPANMARRADGTVVLYDWDEAVVGPAGLSLHHLFGGSAPVVAALTDSADAPQSERSRHLRRSLDAYIDTLADHDYAKRETLCKALPAAAVAGTILYLVGFSRFPTDDGHLRRRIGKNLKNRFSDLLDVIDRLEVRAGAGKRVVERSRLYLRHDRSSRAEHLLARFLAVEPEHVNASTLHGDLLRRAGKLGPALAAYRNSLELRPESVSANRGAAGVHSLNGNYQRAISHLRTALRVRESDGLTSMLHRIHEYETSWSNASLDGAVPALRFSDRERARGAPRIDTVNLAERLFRRHGILILRNAFDTAMLDECRQAFMTRYERYLGEERQKDALRIGDKRFQITIDIRGPFAHPDIVGNPLVLPLQRRLVGRDCILGCFTSAMSLPGSADQRMHKDHKALFHDDPETSCVPSFAVTTMVPLVPIDERNGTTRVKKGSHRLTSDESASLPTQTPRLELGDCYLMDYRLSHHGQANRSDQARPIMSLVYQRPWFRDYINFKGQPSLRIDQSGRDNLPDHLKPLLAWTGEPGADSTS